MAKDQPPSRIPIPNGVYVTKYALTKGIKFYPNAAEIQFYSWNYEKNDWDTRLPGMVDVGEQSFHGEGREWHRTLEGAKAQVKKMIEAKKKSIAKQLKALDAYDYSVEVVAERQREE